VWVAIDGLKVAYWSNDRNAGLRGRREKKRRNHQLGELGRHGKRR